MRLVVKTWTDEHECTGIVQPKFIVRGSVQYGDSTHLGVLKKTRRVRRAATVTAILKRRMGTSLSLLVGTTVLCKRSRFLPGAFPR